MIKRITMMFFLIFSLYVTPTFAGIDVPTTTEEIDTFRILKNDFLDEEEFKEIAKIKEEKATTYTVQKGDTLYQIALNHNIQLEDLFKWNGLESDLIYPGDVLAISEEGKKYSKLISTLRNKKEVASNKPKTVTTSGETEPKTGKELMVTATAYTAYCKGCSGTTAYGIDLRANPDQKVIAVDPKVIPLGTKVWVEGYGVAIAGDTGGAIKGNKIDVFIPTYEDAMKWGVKKIKIKILE